MRLSMCPGFFTYGSLNTAGFLNIVTQGSKYSVQGNKAKTSSPFMTQPQNVTMPVTQHHFSHFLLRTVINYLPDLRGRDTHTLHPNGRTVKFMDRFQNLFSLWPHIDLHFLQMHKHIPPFQGSHSPTMPHLALPESKSGRSAAKPPHSWFLSHSSLSIWTVFCQERLGRSSR